MPGLDAIAKYNAIKLLGSVPKVLGELCSSENVSTEARVTPFGGAQTSGTQQK